ncbi:tRNA preQ1(34) S-adenosylmethionine ribosyltransferase-isomerase QueA [Patescibacteria group bacterium]|nr:tRNA preQ1(34) S-adenosylmethionine ribosyltransferase-isomerase QueA [Patescibacteria group bacterium]
MHTRDFDYHLPGDRIAQHPLADRTAAKLLYLPRAENDLTDLQIRDLPSLLKSGDLLVFNDSKVFRARLQATRTGGTAPFEVFLLRPDGDTWLALIKHSKRLSVGETILLPEETGATIIQKDADGVIRLAIKKSTSEVFALCDRAGEIPTPPYVASKITDADSYQTVYAKHLGSVAAPTAGFHFTTELLEQLKTKGVQTAFVTLHVGLGTFRPMQDGTLDEHIMHEEWVSVSQKIVDTINTTRQTGGRIIAIGTTSCRSLESAARTGTLQPFEGMTNLFIQPGYQFQVIDGLLTNFHLPKSTLLVLVSALLGRERVLNAYQHAMEQNYRFYSFGDAMLIV